METILKILDVSLYVLETHQNNDDEGIKKIENELKGIKDSIFEYERKKTEKMKKLFRNQS